MRNAHHNILEPKAMSSNCNQQSKDPKTSFTILNNKLNFCLNHYLNNSSIIDIGDSFSVDRLITVAWQADNNHFCFSTIEGKKSIAISLIPLDVFKLLFVQPTVQTYSVFYHIKQRKATNPHVLGAGITINNYSFIETAVSSCSDRSTYQ